MDNFNINITCEGDELLAQTIALVFAARGLDRTPQGARPDYKRPGATHYAVRPVVEGARQEMPDGFNGLAPWKFGLEPKPHRLVFYDNRYSSEKPEGGDQVALPFTLDAEGAADFARRWLAEADYGSQPDHDGDNGRGWRVYNEGWGHVDGHRSAIVAITPVWAMYGK